MMINENHDYSLPLDIDKEIQSYENYLRLANFQLSTVKAYVRTVRIFLTYACAQGIVGLPDQDDVQTYLLMRVDAGKSWSTYTQNVPITKIITYITNQIEKHCSKGYPIVPNLSN